MDFLAALEGYWLARRRDFSPHTILDYELTFKRFGLFIKAKPLVDIASSDIHAFLNFVQRKYSLADKTLANVWAALSSFWTWAELELQIAHVIRGKVRRPEYRAVPIEPYSKSEIMAMIAATEQTASWRTRNGRQITSKRPTALRDKTIIIVLLDTGIRASELCALQFRDYEKDSGRLTVQHGKGNKKRTVYLGESSRKYLWRYFVSRGKMGANDPIFITRKSTALESSELLNMIVATAKRAGVSHANVHKFRHTFAINFLRNGGNVLELQRLLGHERMETVRIYVQLAQMDLANAHAAASPADNWGL
jgi:integrase/recombinase XerD